MTFFIAGLGPHVTAGLGPAGGLGPQVTAGLGPAGPVVHHQKLDHPNCGESFNGQPWPQALYFQLAAGSISQSVWPDNTLAWKLQPCAAKGAGPRDQNMDLVHNSSNSLKLDV